ncbi:MAG: nucleotidyltransferase domain-containing protein [Dehalococcoidia bacterium]|nr:nucleotidyltransferase domain-containing protein [Dehalococcoidia bacterium]
MVATAVGLNTSINEFVEHLKAGLRLEAVILYGSHARGSAHEWSDIDLAVISPDFENTALPKRQRAMANLTLDTDPLIAPLGYPSSEYHNPDPHSFLGEIIRTGRVVYQAEPAA